MDGYSRIVSFLKVALPLAALVLLSTLFLLSRPVDPDATIPFSDAEIAERLRGQQISAPFHAATTGQGAQIMFSASRASAPGNAAPVVANDVFARVTLPGGAALTMRGQGAQVSTSDVEARVSGDVGLYSTTGYDLRSEALRFALDRVHVVSPGPVHGTGLFGTISAGAMELASDDQSGSAHLRFTEGVKLLYQPRNLLKAEP